MGENFHEMNEYGRPGEFLMTSYIWDQEEASLIDKRLYRCLKLLHITLPDMAIQLFYMESTALLLTGVIISFSTWAEAVQLIKSIWSEQSCTSFDCQWHAVK